MQNNFDSLDNLELRVQKTSVVQQRAGLVAVYMYKQFIEFHQATLNTNDMFSKVLENLGIVLDYLKQSLNIRNVPVQNVKKDNIKIVFTPLHGTASVHLADLLKEEGYKKSIELSKEYGLYRQDYCGCVYSMKEKSLKE